MNSTKKLFPFLILCVSILFTIQACIPSGGGVQPTTATININRAVCTFGATPGSTVTCDLFKLNQDSTYTLLQTKSATVPAGNMLGYGNVTFSFSGLPNATYKINSSSHERIISVTRATTYNESITDLCL